MSGRLQGTSRAAGTPGSSARLRARTLLVGAGVLAVGGLASVVAQASAPPAYAATASLAPALYYIGDATGSIYTFTVNNTGASSSIGAVEFDNPSTTTIVACPSAPAGWTAQVAATKCRYRSATSTSDDIQHGQSRTFTVKAKTDGGINNRLGTWGVVVSKSNQFDNPSLLKNATATGPGLTATLYTFEVTDAVVADLPVAPGAGCPAANKSALIDSTKVIVICGKNRATANLWPNAANSSLSGTFIQSPGTFTSASIVHNSANVVLGNWQGAHVANTFGTGTFKVITSIGSAANRTSPLRTFTGYSTTTHPPVANDDSYNTNEDTALSVVAPGVLGNDTDPDGDPLTASLGTGPSHAASFALHADGSFDYTPVADYNGSDSFTYKANDTHVDSAPATVHITVNPVNDAPVASAVTDSTDEDTAKAITLDASDIDGDSLTYSIVSGPSKGTLGLVTGNSVTYTPNANYNGPDSFTYKASDGSLDSNTATVSITVNSVNDAPVANNDSASTNEDTPLSVPASGVLGNDTDVESTPLTATLVDGPSHAASFTFNADGSYDYTPVADYNGPDSFTYKANDGSADSNTATVNITVNPVNDAPVASAVSDSTNEDTAKAITLNASDVDSGSLTYSIVSGPTYGTLGAVTGNSVTYTPNANYNGPDSFTYKADDGSLDSNTATVSITVNSVNDAPVANNDSASTNEDTPLHVSAPGVLGNDTDVEGTPLVATLVVGPSHVASFTLNADGSYDYTPVADYNGPDSFTYKANDGTDDSNTATVNITVNAVNDAPVAAPVSDSTNEDTAKAITLNASDVDSGSLTYSIVSGPAYGTLGTVSGDSVTYTPNANYHGPDSFTYKASDGSLDSNTATVSITVTSVNDAPVATNDAYQTLENTALNVAANGVLGNDTDVDTDPLTAVLVAGPGHAASFTLNSDGSFDYTPATSYTGPDSFTYKANDGTDDSNTATVNITVVPPNATPTADATSASGNEDGGAIVVTLTGHDNDDDNLTFTAGAASHGTVGTPTAVDCSAAKVCTATVTYTPFSNYNGGDSFTYTVNDGTVDSAPATATLTVDPVNDAPSFVKGANQVNNEDDPAVTVTGWASVISPGPADESAQTVTFVVTNNSNSALFSVAPAVSSAGDLTYTLAPDANGLASVTLHAHDNGGAGNGGVDDSAPQTFTITVNAVNDTPSFTKGNDQTVNEDAGAQTVNPWATALNKGAANESAQVLTFHVSNDKNAMFSVQPAVSSSGVLTYTPAANKYGVAIVTVNVSDNGGGADTSADQTFTITVDAVNDAPTAADKTYSAETNMKINLTGLLTGATDTADTAEQPGYTPVYTVGTITPCSGCTVSGVDAAAGTFDFDPPAGQTGTFHLSYTLVDSGYPTPGATSAPADIAVTVSGPTIWFVDATNGSDGGTGRLSGPFQTLAKAATVDGANHRIYLYNGTYSDGIALNGGEWLTGSGAVASSFDSLMGITPPTGTIARPTINGSRPNVGSAVVLGSGNTLRGVTFKGATALSGTSFGTLTLGSGANADVAIDSTGAALSLDTGTISGDFVSTQSTSGANNVSLTSVASTGTTLGTGALSGATADSFKVNGGSGTFTYGGSITNASVGTAVTVINKGSGTVTLSGAVNDTSGPGVSLVGNTSTTTFTGGVTLSSGTSSAFAASSGGTVNVTGANNTITSTTGTALNITSTTIGASNVTFKSIAANGALNGIVLNTTGNSGHLAVTGTGVADSGGIIQNTTGDGILLNSTLSPSFDWIKISNAAHAGIQGALVHGFSLTHSMITGVGSALSDPNDYSVSFNDTSSSTANNVDGAVTITNNTLSNSYGGGVQIFQYNGTISDANISNNTISSSNLDTASKGDGIALNLFGSTTTVASITKAEINTNTITNFPNGGGIRFQGANTASATAPAGFYGSGTTPGSGTNIIQIHDNLISGDAGNHMENDAISASVTGRGSGSFDILRNGVVGNALRNMKGEGVAIGGAGDVTIAFNVQNNVVQGDAVAGLNSTGIGFGIDKNIQTGGAVLASPTMNAVISNNTVTGTQGYGIQELLRDSNAIVNLKIQSNTVGAPSNAAFSSIAVSSGSSGSLTYDPTLCANISSNTAATGAIDPGFGDARPGIELFKRSTSATTYVFGIVGLSPSPATRAQTESYVGTQNPASGAGLGAFAGKTVSTNSSSDNYTSCTLPF